MARILVAEDDAALRRLYTIWLESAGHQVTEAADGREALEQIQRRAPEAAILDVEMPFVDGLSVARYLHARDARTAIVIISGIDDIRADALSAGAAEVLAKPCDRAALRAALDAAAWRPELCANDCTVSVTRSPSARCNPAATGA